MSAPLKPAGYILPPELVAGVQQVVDEMGRLGLLSTAVGAAAFSALTGSPEQNALLALALAVKLESGNFKTVNGNSLIGAGNIVVTGGGASGDVDGGSPTESYTGVTGVDGGPP